MTRTKNFIKATIFKLAIKTWSVLPAKKTVAKCVNFFPKIKLKLYKDLRFRGVMKLKIHNKSFSIFNPSFTTIENELFWFGMDGWDKLAIHIWAQLSKNARQILDIGANTGLYSLVAAAINPQATIVAFEPVKRTADLFKKNIELNKFDFIRLEEKAVSNQSGFTAIFDADSISQYSASLNENMLKAESNIITYSVETLLIDDYFEREFNDVDLIKIDVEMHEPEAIAGMIQLISKNHPSIIIEILNLQIAKQVEDLLIHLDYQYFAIDNLEVPKKIESLSYENCQNYLIITKENFKKLKF